MRAPAAIAAFLAIALAASGCAKKKEEPRPPPPIVSVATPLVTSVTDWDDFVGHFEAVDTVQVRPRVSGYLQSVAFRDGDVVRKGQLLFVIDPRPYQAALDQARAQAERVRATLANARAERTRTETLVAGRAASQQELQTRITAEQTAAADLAAGDAAIRAAALNLGFTRVSAPITGRISDRKVSAGNLVGTDQTVLTSIVTVDPIRFVFTGSEASYLKYQRQNAAGTRTSSRFRANPVEIRLQGEDSYRIKGRMDFVDNTVDPNSGTIRGRAVVPNPGAFLTPGLFGHLRLLGSGAYKALLVPDSAIVADQSRQIVYVVGQDGKLAARVVKPGQLVHGLRVVGEGLKPEDRVVVDNIGAAKPGTKPRLRQGKITPDPGNNTGGESAPSGAT